MAHIFEEAVVAAILSHMNDDHSADNILIARAFGPEAEITTAEMTGFDGDGGGWRIARDGVEQDIRVPWPGGPIDERAAVRREIVALYDASCARLGIAPRAHG